MSDKKAELEREIAELERKLERNEQARSIAKCLGEGMQQLAFAVAESDTLEGADKVKAKHDIGVAKRALLVAVRNSDIKSHFMEAEFLFNDIADDHGIDIAKLPGHGEPGGHLGLSDWAKWMKSEFGYASTRPSPSSMETLLFPAPPSIDEVNIGLISIDEYLEAVSEWKELIDSKAPAPTKPRSNPFDLRTHGASQFAYKLGINVSACLQSRNDAGRFGFHMAMMERNLERWRNTAKAAGGKKGRKQSWHGYFIEQAARSEYGDSFESVLDYLDDMTQPCTFDVDHQEKVIRVLHDDDDKANDVTFAAARKMYTRARNKNRK